MDESVRSPFAILNVHARLGEEALPVFDASPAEAWDDVLTNHPSWQAIGVFGALLDRAHEELDRAPARSLAISAFVLKHVDSLPADPLVLLVQVRGNARKEYGNALWMRKRYQEALAAADEAVTILETHPVLVVDRAAALLLRAQTLHALRRDTAAVLALDECIQTFATHSDGYRYVLALELRAFIHFDQGAYAPARETLLLAFREADHLGLDQEVARINNNLGQCALLLGELDDARASLLKALVTFTQHAMDVEAQRAVWGMATVAAKVGDVTPALEVLHGVYAEFLHRGLPEIAATVLLDIAVIVTELTKSPTYAKRMCAKLATTLGGYDISADVRAAVEDLGRTPKTASRQVLTRRMKQARAQITLSRNGPSPTERRRDT